MTSGLRVETAVARRDVDPPVHGRIRVHNGARASPYARANVGATVIEEVRDVRALRVPDSRPPVAQPDYRKVTDIVAEIAEIS